MNLLIIVHCILLLRCALLKPIDLLPLPSSEKVNFDAKQRAELILKMHELTKENIVHMNAKYKFAGDKGRQHVVFAPANLV